VLAVRNSSIALPVNPGAIGDWTIPEKDHQQQLPSVKIRPLDM
jgi:hypothetical protein